MRKTIMVVLGIIMMGIIFLFSSCNADLSALQSQYIVDFISNYIPVNSFLIRKLAHFSLFFVLEIILYMCLKSFMWSGMLVSLYAVLDEFHQYFVPGRSCEIRDMMIDIGGCLVAILIIKLWRYLHVKRKTNNEKNG